MLSHLSVPYRFSIAPMMDWTDRHCRMFHRQLTRQSLLYTEMVTTGAVLHGNRDHLLGFSEQEKPLAVQLGGSDPHDLAQAARICADFGYDEINLNVGCPSDRVQSGRFGACMMREPDTVAACIVAMKSAVSIPVTVKCRLGVDEQVPQQALWEMAQKLVNAGVDRLIVHARKAWLDGISPKQNRTVPPLDYPLVYQLKQDMGDLPIVLNGGIETLADARHHLDHVDGVMLGRAAYHDPWILLNVDTEIFSLPPPVTDMKEAIESFLTYVEAQLQHGVRLSAMTRHLVGAFHAVRGARRFRQILAEQAHQKGAGIEVVINALKEVEEQENDVSSLAETRRRGGIKTDGA